MENKHILDTKNLTSDQRDKLESWKQAEDQLKNLQDIAAMTHEVIAVLDDKQKFGDKSTKEIGALLVDMRDSLAALNKKEAPDVPDHAKPVVDAVAKLEKALSTAIKTIDVKPSIRVEAPQVNVSPTPIDLKGVEKILKTDLPKAFEQAIKLIPKEKEDYSPLLQAWEGISQQLESIETATRMKPLPGSMKVTNTDGTVVGSILSAGAATSTLQTANAVTQSEEAILLRRIVKLLESNAVVDIQSRQRVVIDSITIGASGLGVAVAGASSLLASTNYPTNLAPTQQPATMGWQPVWIGPVDQRFQIIDAARLTYDQGIRSHLSFS